jgi:hypothetical protein
MPTITQEQSDRAKAGIKARRDAINTLIERHQDEFDELHMKNRVAAGLPPRSSGPSKTELEERIRKQKEKLEKWEAELRLSS